jgi:hypothetical protein
MSGCDKQFQRRIERMDHLRITGQHGRVGDRAERRALTKRCLDGGDRRARVVGPGGLTRVESASVKTILMSRWRLFGRQS